jgi:hypothetical protein
MIGPYLTASSPALLGTRRMEVNKEIYGRKKASIDVRDSE